MGKTIKRLISIWILVLSVTNANAQAFNGTTGLLHAPSADMQKDKTFMFGGNILDLVPLRYFDYNEIQYTYNYYINITFFPWLEVAYTCTIIDEWRSDRKVYMKNQDRFFSGRLRLWKEGWWKEWTPQIVVGGNDVLHGSGHGGDIGAIEGSGTGGNTFYQRYYVAATKHLSWYGEWGIHAAYVYSKRIGHQFNGVAVGVDYQFALKGEEPWQKAVNGLNLMAEYDSKFVNIGAKYAVWKDHINIITELRECKYPSVGVFFKVHLK